MLLNHVQPELAQDSMHDSENNKSSGIQQNERSNGGRRRRARNGPNKRNGEAALANEDKVEADEGANRVAPAKPPNDPSRQQPPRSAPNHERHHVSPSSQHTQSGLQALFRETKQPAMSTAPSTEPPPGSLQASDIEGQLLAKADGSSKLADLAVVHAKLLEMMKQRAELDTLVSQEVQGLVSESRRLAGFRDQERDLLAQLEAEKKAHAAAVEALLAQLAERDLHVSSLQQQLAESASKIAAQEQQLAKKQEAVERLEAAQRQEGASRASAMDMHSQQVDGLRAALQQREAQLHEMHRQMQGWIAGSLDVLDPHLRAMSGLPPLTMANPPPPGPLNHMPQGKAPPPGFNPWPHGMPPPDRSSERPGTAGSGHGRLSSSGEQHPADRFTPAEQLPGGPPSGPPANGAALQPPLAAARHDGGKPGLQRPHTDEELRGVFLGLLPEMGACQLTDSHFAAAEAQLGNFPWNAFHSGRHGTMVDFLLRNPDTFGQRPDGAFFRQQQPTGPGGPGAGPQAGGPFGGQLLPGPPPPMAGWHHYDAGFNPSFLPVPGAPPRPAVPQDPQHGLSTADTVVPVPSHFHPRQHGLPWPKEGLDLKVAPPPHMNGPGLPPPPHLAGLQGPPRMMQEFVITPMAPGPFPRGLPPVMGHMQSPGPRA